MPPGPLSNPDHANEPPSHNRVSGNVFHDLGKTLVHVAAVSLRASSNNIISYNRITTMPRYALEADSFYNLSVPGGRISRDNLFEFNVIDDVCFATTVQTTQSVPTGIISSCRDLRPILAYASG